MHVFDNPQGRGYARLTGLFYLGIAVSGAFSIAYVPGQIIVVGDQTATLGNMVGRAGLLRAGIAADAALMALEVMVLSMLYFMFRPVSPTLSLAAAVARLAMVVVMAAMLLFRVGAEALARTDAAGSAFTLDQRAELAGLLLDMSHAGIWVWQVFFALHLMLLGWLVMRSGRFPRLIGQGLMIGAGGYLLDSVHAYAFADVAVLGTLRAGLLVIVTLSEVGFALWLLVRGPRATDMRTGVATA